MHKGTTELVAAFAVSTLRVLRRSPKPKSPKRVRGGDEP